MQLTLRAWVVIMGMAVLIGQPVTGMAETGAPAGKAVHLQRLSEMAEGSNRQFFCQNDIDLQPDNTYVLTFWAKSPQSLAVRISMKVSQAPWSSVGEPQQIELTSEWQKHEVNLEGTGAIPGKTRLTFNFGSSEAGDIWLADLRLRNAAGDESSGENLIANARFEDGLEKWYSEGQRADIFQIKVQPLAEASTP